MLIFRIFWWSWWVMFWGIVLFLLFGCTSTNWETGMMREANVACADELSSLDASLQRRDFKLACK